MTPANWFSPCDVNSADRYLVNLGPSWARGPWSVSFWAGLNHNEFEREYSRTRQDIPSGLITTDTGDIKRAFDAAYGWLQIGYKPNAENTFNISANLAGGGPDLLQPIVRENSLGPVLNQVTQTNGGFDYRAISFDYQHDGDRPREQLTFNLAFDESGDDTDQNVSQAPDGDALSRFATHTASDTDS